jgi:hypothetical protein
MPNADPLLTLRRRVTRTSFRTFAFCVQLLVSPPSLSISQAKGVRIGKVRAGFNFPPSLPK